MRDLNKTGPSTTKKTLVLLFCVALPVVAMLIPVVISMVQSNSTGSNKDLDVNVRSGISTIELRNNESETLYDCKVTINNQYSNRATISSKPTEYGLGTFTKKDGERFNPFTYEAKTIRIEDCSGQPGRSAIYGN